MDIFTKQSTSFLTVEEPELLRKYTVPSVENRARIKGSGLGFKGRQSPATGIIFV